MGKRLCGTGECVTEAFLSLCCSLSLPHVPFSHVVHAKTLHGKSSFFLFKKTHHTLTLRDKAEERNRFLLRDAAHGAEHLSV